MYRKWYPPARYLFYPLYRQLRARWRLPCVFSYFAVWVVSGTLHGGVLLMFGHPAPAVAIALVFLGLGVAGSAAIVMKARHRRSHRAVADARRRRG